MNCSYSKTLIYVESYVIKTHSVVLNGSILEYVLYSFFTYLDVSKSITAVIIGTTSLTRLNNKLNSPKTSTLFLLFVLR